MSHNIHILRWSAFQYWHKKKDKAEKLLHLRYGKWYLSEGEFWCLFEKIRKLFLSLMRFWCLFVSIKMKHKDETKPHHTHHDCHCWPSQGVQPSLVASHHCLMSFWRQKTSNLTRFRCPMLNGLRYADDKYQSGLWLSHILDVDSACLMFQDFLHPFLTWFCCIYNVIWFAMFKKY